MLVDIRDADLAEAPVLAGLMAAFGYPVDADALRPRLERLIGLGEVPLVAVVDTVVVGVLTWHVTPVLHRPAPVGRITAMVVAESWRGRGVGAALVLAAEQRLAARGCSLMEVTSHDSREAAHRFYQRLGYERSGVRLGKVLAG